MVEPIDEQLDEMFDENWGDIEARSFEELPDGSYQVRVLAAVVNNAQTSGRLQCSWENLVIEGEQKGRHIFKHDGLDTEDGIAFFKGTLGRLGYDEPETKKQLLKILEEIVEGPTYAVMRLSTRKRKIQGEIQPVQGKRYIKALDSDEVEDDFEEEELLPTMSSASSSPAEEEETEEETTFEKGDRVQAEIDGETYEGIIKSVKKLTAVVTFDDGDEFPVAFEMLRRAEGEEEEEEEKEGFEKGDRVKVDIDGTYYPGKIKKIGKEKATVVFDDGDELSIELDKLEEEEEEEEEKEKEEEGTETEEPSCELKDDTKFTPVERRTTVKFAKKYDFNPKDFDTKASLLCEIGDYCGVSGTFKKPSTLIKAIKEAAEKEKD